MNRITTGALAMCATLSFTTPTFAHEGAASVPAPLTHAPIGMMGDHKHGQGEWMAAYRYMHMEMSGLRNGTQDITPAQVPTPMVPERMEADMHMLGGMYGLTEGTTIAVGIPYIEKDMTMRMKKSGMAMTRHSEGWGDLKFMTLSDIDLGLPGKTQINLGMTAPTGSIDETDGGMVLGYGMQLGSGTYDALAGLNWRLEQGMWGYGVQYAATLRTGRNDAGYRLGHVHKATAYVAHAVSNSLSFSALVEGQSQGRTKGVDPRLAIKMTPANDPSTHGGESVKGLVGFNWYGPDGFLKDHRFAAEYSWNLYQDTNGPQLKQDGMFVLGWQKAF